MAVAVNAASDDGGIYESATPLAEEKPSEASFRLVIQNVITLLPTMEEFQDELKFLKSDAVQNAGKKCGIVRVRSV